MRPVLPIPWTRRPVLESGMDHKDWGRAPVWFQELGHWSARGGRSWTGHFGSLSSGNEVTARVSGVQVEGVALSSRPSLGSA